MKETYRLHFSGILILLFSMLALAITLGEYIFIGILSIPVIIFPFIKFRFNLSRRQEYIIYGILLIPVLLKYFSQPPNYAGLMMPFMHLVAFYLIVISIFILYRVKRKNDLLSFYFLAVCILSLAGLSTVTFYFEIFVIIQVLLSSFYFRSLLKYQYNSLTLTFNRRGWVAVFIAIILSGIIFIWLNRFIVWLEPKTNFLSLPPGNSGLNYSGFLNETTLTVTGNMKLSGRVVLRIYSSCENHRVRCKVFTDYTKGKWKTFPEKKSLSPDTSGKVSSFFAKSVEGNIFFPEFAISGLKASSVTICNIKVTPGLNTVFFTIPGTFCIKSSLPQISFDQYGIFYPSTPVQGMDYTLAGLSDAETVICPEEKDPNLCLTIPDYLNPEILSLSKRLTTKKDVYDKCLAVEEYFHSQFQYSLGFIPSGTGDPVEEFILGKKSAHCEYFATGMVLLLRASGIPARYVTGFLVHEYSKTFGYYIVRERDAHAWVEAFVPGRGWLTFDPTPAGGNFEKLLGPDEPNIFSQLIDIVLFKWEEFKYLLINGDYLRIIKWIEIEMLATVNWLYGHPLISIFIIIFILLFVFQRKIYVHIFREPAHKDIIETEELRRFHSVLSRFDDIMKKRGVSRKDNITLYEYMEHLKEQSDEEMVELCGKFIDAYCKMRYASQEIIEGDFISLEKSLHELEKMLILKQRSP